jgi:hypothetical protein
MGYDEDGRSREVDDHPEQVEQSKIASAPHGVRSELPPTDSTDPSAWLRDFVHHGDVDPDGWRRAWGEA